MNNNFLVATGTILKEYMNARNISQKELAKVLDSSERHISNLINGNAKLSEELALKLERAFPDIKAEFWLDIEKNYRLNLLRDELDETEEIKNIAKDYKFDYVFEGLRYNLVKQAKEMLNILGVKNFQEAEENIKKLNYNFMEDGGDEKAIYVWLKMCEYELDIQNDIESLPNLDINVLQTNMIILKKLIHTTDFDLAEKNIRRFLNHHGIAIVILEAVPTSKVRGATSKINNIPVIFLSTRFKQLDSFYFTLIHELIHIFNNDYRYRYLITYDKDEDEILSNRIARDFFVNQEDYRSFSSQFNNKKEVSDEEIIIFARQQKVIPDIIIGFLEHDNIIKDRSKYYHLKNGIK